MKSTWRGFPWAVPSVPRFARYCCTDPVGPVPELLGAYVSSVIPDPMLASDLLLDPASPEHRGTNLKVVSIIRLHKLATIHLRDVYRHLGDLSPATMQEVENRVRTFLTL